MTCDICGGDVFAVAVGQPEVRELFLLRRGVPDRRYCLVCWTQQFIQGDSSMSRSGYTDDYEDERMLAMWRGQVASAIRGKRGQAFLRELVEALDAMPEKRLIACELETEEGVCALGCVGRKRGINLALLDPEHHRHLAEVFDVARQLVQEVEYINDDDVAYWVTERPDRRWQRVRDWAARSLREAPP